MPDTPKKDSDSTVSPDRKEQSNEQSQNTETGGTKTPELTRHILFDHETVPNRKNTRVDKSDIEKQ